MMHIFESLLACPGRRRAVFWHSFGIVRTATWSSCGVGRLPARRLQGGAQASTAPASIFVAYFVAELREPYANHRGH